MTATPLPAAVAVRGVTKLYRRYGRRQVGSLKSAFVSRRAGAP